MGNVIVGIHQPNFMPWLGYFYKIFKSDIFIFLDDVQFQKTGASYTNRVSVNTNGTSQYLTISIKRTPGLQNINEVKFLNEQWKRKAIGTLQANYGKTKHFKENSDFIFSLINYNTDNISEYNINFITKVSSLLSIDTKFVKSSDYNITSTSTQRLVDLILNSNGNKYLSGNGGDKYQDANLYKDAGIELLYNTMPNFEYQQEKNETFINGLSIIDAIFNIGIEKLKKDLFQ